MKLAIVDARWDMHGKFSFHAKINLGVHDVKDIKALCRDLKKIEDIVDVRRE